MGSLTKLGETLSIDAQIIDVTTANTLPSISVQGKGLVSLGMIAARLKAEVIIRTGLVQKIAKIEIKGNRKIEASAITAQIKSKVCNHFFKADITADIKTIFKMGFFLDVTAEAISTPEGKVVIFTVQE